MEWLSVLPNLSIGVISVIALAYLSLKHQEAVKIQRDDFLGVLKEIRTEHESRMQERELAFRSLEKEVRSTIMEQLAENTATMKQVIAHIMK